MKNIIYILSLLLFASVALHAQDSEVRSLDGFSEIHVSSSVDAELRKGSKNEVKIKVRNADLEDVITEIDGDRLEVGMRKNWGKRGWKKGTKVLVVITYTDDPTYVGVSSSSDLISHDVIKTDKLTIKCSSSADMEIEVDVNTLMAKVSSSSDVDIEGRADQVKIEASSSSDFNGQHLKTKDAIIRASSSSDVEISVSDSIEAKASSSSDILYYGSPSEKDISKSSSGSVHRMKG